MSLIDVTVTEVVSRKLQRIGVLSTPVTRRYGLYSRVLRRRGVQVVELSPAHAADVESAIRHTIGGAAIDQAPIQKSVAILQACGAQAVILGCTELSLIMSGATGGTVIDPMDYAVQKALAAIAM